jgi:hypothetical protein
VEAFRMSRVTVRARLLPVFVAAALATGCAAGSSSSPSADVSTGPSPSEAAAPSQGGEESAMPSEPACPPAVCDGPIAAGDYTTTSTGLTISFTLAGDGWLGVGETRGDGFALFNENVTEGQYGIWVIPFHGEVFTDVCSPEATETIGTSAADFTAFLTGRDGITAGDPVNVTVGGVAAIQVDLTAASPCPEAGRMWMWTLPVHGDFHFDDGDVLRVWTVEGGGATVAILVEASADTYDAVLALATDLLATMTIAPAS